MALLIDLFALRFSALSSVFFTPSATEIRQYLLLQELPPELELEKKALIRQLQTRLRNEEMSLVLLKKIRQSQVLAEQAKEASKVSIQPANSVKSHRGTPPLPQNSKKPVTNSASSRPGSGGQSMKTPDLSLLKPVNVVILKIFIDFCQITNLN